VPEAAPAPQIQYDDIDRHTRFVRKMAWLRWVAVVETCSYLALLWAWLGGHPLLTGVIGSAHGMIWTGFVAMLLEARRPMRWTWAYVAVAIVTGPVGAVLVFERLRRQGIPADAATA
jgi:integral membrane protein